jgi:hypothetical protein
MLSNTGPRKRRPKNTGEDPKTVERESTKPGKDGHLNHVSGSAPSSRSCTIRPKGMSDKLMKEASASAAWGVGEPLDP